jgi:DNA-binding Lrp family transcriptional regulator
LAKLLAMDEFDRKILASLQSEGRLSITDLAERVNLSVSPCHRRLRALEQSGVIKGYRAQLDHCALGLGFSAIVFVTLREGDSHAVGAFEEAVAEVPQVIQAQRLFGEPDYLLHVISRDLPAFQRLYDERLSTLPGVQRLNSTLVMKTVVGDRPLPLGAT